MSVFISFFLREYSLDIPLLPSSFLFENVLMACVFLCPFCLMTQLAKHAPPLITKLPKASTWDHHRRVITRFIVKEIVIAWRL
jgi:hypothetical protein